MILQQKGPKNWKQKKNKETGIFVVEPGHEAEVVAAEAAASASHTAAVSLAALVTEEERRKAS